MRFDRKALLWKQRYGKGNGDVLRALLHGIYVLAVNGELLVKRLQFDRIFNRLHIISDNTKYRPVEIPLEGLDNVRILGKVVIWVHGEV